MKKLIISLLVAMVIALTLPNADAATNKLDQETTYQQAPIKVLGW